MTMKDPIDPRRKKKKKRSTSKKINFLLYLPLFITSSCAGISCIFIICRLYYLNNQTTLNSKNLLRTLEPLLSLCLFVAKNVDDIFDNCEVHEKVCTNDCQMPFDNDNGTWDQCNHSQVCLVQVNETDNQPLKSWMICLLDELNLTTTLPTVINSTTTGKPMEETTSKMDLSFKFRKS